MLNEFNEGEPYDEINPPNQDPVEKAVISSLFNRMEKRKMTTIPGVNMMGVHGSKGTKDPFPRGLYNKSKVLKIVKDQKEMDEAYKMGFMTNKDLQKIGRPNIVADLILAKEDELSVLVEELKGLIGDKDYEEFLVKRQKATAKEEK